MKSRPSLENWLQHLRVLHPVTGLVHVGPGRGAATRWYADWELPAAVLIEADADHRSELGALASQHAGWVVCTAVATARPGPVEFHLFSNHQEHSTLALAELSTVWRNLKLRETRNVQGVPVAELVKTAGVAEANWLIVECLPAVGILEGAEALLPDADVVLARTCSQIGALDGTGAEARALTEWLQVRGFEHVVSEEERHPAFVMALYVRRWKAAVSAGTGQLEVAQQMLSDAERSHAVEAGQLRQAAERATLDAQECRLRITQLELALAEQRTFAGGLAAELERARRGNEDEVRQSGELRAELNDVRQARVVAEQALADHRKQVTQLRELFHTQSKLADERADMLSQEKTRSAELSGKVLSLQAKVEQAKLVQEQQARDSMVARVGEAELVVLRDELSRVRQAFDKFVQQQARLDRVIPDELLQLRAEKVEWSARNQFLNDELAKAEQGLALVNDLMADDQQRASGNAAAGDQ